jgi:hypothetical protein
MNTLPWTRHSKSAKIQAGVYKLLVEAAPDRAADEAAFETRTPPPGRLRLPQTAKAA